MENKQVTLRDVAKRCGLSVYPVSRALSGKPGVTTETADHIRGVAASMGYASTQNQTARRLALRKSGELPVNHVIGLLIPGRIGKINFFYELFRGVAEAVSENGFGLLVIPTYDPVEHRSLDVKLPPSVLRGEIDGLLVHLSLPAGIVRQLREDTEFGARPIVSMTSRMPSASAAVLRDERGGARLAMKHLLDLGHRQIMYLRHRNSGYPMTEREAGYRQACMDAGLETEECLVAVYCENDHDVEVPLAAALARHASATALLTINDPNAINACFALKRLGVRIPDEISVMGWDDTDAFTDSHGKNQLTSIRFDIAGLGRNAAENLMARIGGRGAETETEILMPPELMRRGSTGRPGESTNDR